VLPRLADRTEYIVFSDFLEPGCRIGADDCLLDDVDQRDRHGGIKVDEAVRTDDFEREVPLAVEFRLETLLYRAGDNVVNNLRLGDRLIGYIALVTARLPCMSSLGGGRWMSSGTILSPRS
jgi:hypothetical protein